MVMELENESYTCLTMLNKVYTLKKDLATLNIVYTLKGRFVGEVQTFNYKIKGKRLMIISPFYYVYCCD
jgi:hypothetical protein